MGRPLRCEERRLLRWLGRGWLGSSLRCEEGRVLRRFGCGRLGSPLGRGQGGIDRFSRGGLGSRILIILPGQHDGHLGGLGLCSLELFSQGGLFGLGARVPGQVSIADRDPIARLDYHRQVRGNRRAVDQDLPGAAQIDQVGRTLDPAQAHGVASSRCPSPTLLIGAVNLNVEKAGLLHPGNLLGLACWKAYLETRCPAHWQTRCETGCASGGRQVPSNSGREVPQWLPAVGKNQESPCLCRSRNTLTVTQRGSAGRDRESGSLYPATPGASLA